MMRLDRHLALVDGAEGDLVLKVPGLRNCHQRFGFRV